MSEYQPISPDQLEAVVFEQHPQHDTIWAIALGHDGHVYLGLCLEGQSGAVAQLYRYDTNEQCLQHLADMGDVTGERPDSGHASQGKIHFSLCPARDGKLYGATHCTTPPIGHPIWSPFSMWGDPSMSFPGGHIFRYDTLDDEVLDFGVITPNEGIPYLMLDEERQRLYFLSYPRAHFYSADLRGRQVKDYGRVSAIYPICMIFDQAGNLYTSDDNGRIIKYDVARDELVFLNIQPVMPPWNPEGRYTWVTDMCMGTDGWIYGVLYFGDRLFRFDPRADVPQIEDLGPGLPDGKAICLRCMVPDGQGNIYYMAHPELMSAGGSVLMRYSIADGRREPLGTLTVDGHSHYVWRGVCGPDGALYLATVSSVPSWLLVYRP